LAKYLGEGTSQRAANASSLLFFCFLLLLRARFSIPPALLANSRHGDKKCQLNFGILPYGALLQNSSFRYPLRNKHFVLSEPKCKYSRLWASVCMEGLGHIHKRGSQNSTTEKGENRDA
jgi:hypothetical protein